MGEWPFDPFADRDDSYYNTSDCKWWVYRIIVDGKITREGRHALNQTRKIKNRIVYRKKWNESKKEWRDQEWKQQLNQPNTKQRQEEILTGELK